MTEQNPDCSEREVHEPTLPGDLEQIVDDLEKWVLGHEVDQVRDGRP